MPELTPDELHVLDAYRRVRSEGQGHLFVEFQSHKVSKYEVKFGGQTQTLNALLDAVPMKPTC